MKTLIAASFFALASVATANAQTAPPDLKQMLRACLTGLATSPLAEKPSRAEYDAVRFTPGFFVIDTGFNVSGGSDSRADVKACLAKVGATKN